MKKNQYIAPELKQRLTMELELPIAQSLPVGDSEITDSCDILTKEHEEESIYCSRIKAKTDYGA